MLPTFLPGERVIAVSLLFVHLQVEDVVICSDPRTQRVLIKRIVAIKNDSYFVEGDNKKESTDSRTFGWLKKKNIFAKVIYPKKVYNT